MTSLIVAGVLVLVIAGTRGWIVLAMEHRDDARLRGDAGVIVGAEGFRFDRPQAPGVLLLHGAGDTPQTMRELGAVLYAQGFAVSAPLLPGHGRSIRDFRRVTAGAWHHAALAAYDELSRDRSWTAIVGLSIGGALAIMTAARRPNTAALVLLAPYVALPRTVRAVVALSRIANLISPYYPSVGAESIRDPRAAADDLAYGVFTPAAARALRQTADDAAELLPDVHTPTLIIQSRLDNRIAASVAERALQRLGSAERRLEWVSEGRHVITVDYGKERVFSLTIEWLRSHGADALLRS